MKILLVEDQAEKQAGVRNYLESRYPNVIIEIADSYHSAKKRLLAEEFFIVLLDMSLPIYQKDGQISSVLVYGGEDLLHWAKHRLRNLKAIVITQFDMFPEEGRSRNLAELKADLKSEFGETLISVVRYTESDILWQAELSNFIESKL